MPAKPKSAFPTPAATLPGEADILAGVLADLSDDNAKLVYADWLEDRDDPRGPFLREFVKAHRAGKKLPVMKAAPQLWRDLTGVTLITTLRGTDLASRAGALLALARPAIHFDSKRAAEKSIPVGASKLGGGADLLPDARWPCYGEEPLAFLGQFNFADLGPSPVARELPAAGLISVFCRYDEDDGNDDFPKGSWQLLHFPDASKLRRCPPPDLLFAPCRVEYTETLTIPDADSPWRRELRKLGNMEWGGDYSSLHIDLCPGDHLLGHPFPVQGDVLGKKSVRHLLTICGNDDAGWEWGDGGALYFTLPDADLKAGRFDRVRMEMQCG